MASNKKQFMSIYQQTVDLLKNFKQNNDMINKKIGIDHDQVIIKKIKVQMNMHDKMIQKLQQLLAKLEKSYLDPDTARKIGTIKQQYKIQKDRREYLIISLRESLNQHQQNINALQNSESQNYIKYTLANMSQNQNRSIKHNISKQKESSYLNKRKDSDSNTTTHSISNNRREIQYTQQLTEYDYQIENKINYEKNKAIQQVQKSLLNIYNLTKQTENIVYQQGEQLDIITDELIKTNKNTVYTVQQLKQANENQKKSRGKYIKVSILLIVAAIFVIAICIL